MQTAHASSSVSRNLQAFQVRLFWKLSWLGRPQYITGIAHGIRRERKALQNDTYLQGHRCGNLWASAPLWIPLPFVPSSAGTDASHFTT
jgi:hypothetical protein